MKSTPEEFILMNSEKHSEAVDNGYWIKMEEDEIFEWMEKYSKEKLRDYTKWLRQNEHLNSAPFPSLIDRYENEFKK